MCVSHSFGFARSLASSCVLSLRHHRRTFSVTHDVWAIAPFLSKTMQQSIHEKRIALHCHTCFASLGFLSVSPQSSHWNQTIVEKTDLSLCLCVYFYMNEFITLSLTLSSSIYIPLSLSLSISLSRSHSLCHIKYIYMRSLYLTLSGARRHHSYTKARLR